MSRFTKPVYKPVKRVPEFFSGLFLIILGIMMLPIPILGWMAAVLWFSWGANKTFNSITGIGEFIGPCPHCNGRITVSEVWKGTDCPTCKGRVIVRDRKFFAVPRQ